MGQEQKSGQQSGQQAPAQRGTTNLSHQVAAEIAPELEKILAERMERGMQGHLDNAKRAAPPGAQAAFGGDLAKALLGELGNLVRSEGPVIVNLVIQALQSKGVFADGVNLS